MINLSFSPKALEDFEIIKTFLFENEEEEFFLILKTKIKKAISLLQEFPDLGIYRSERKCEVFIIPKTRYEICFRKENNRLEILRIFHTSQKWEDII